MAGPRLVLVLALSVGVLGPPAGLHAEMLTGPEVRQLVTGNTVAGRYAGGSAFSEYHAADGRALGDNGYTLNVDACWNIDGGNLCYHYGPASDRRTYCFTVEKVTAGYLLRTADSGKLNAIARIEKGNPAGHGDGGRRWSCDDLLSRLEGKGGYPAARTVAASAASGRAGTAKSRGLDLPQGGQSLSGAN